MEVDMGQWDQLLGMGSVDKVSSFNIYLIVFISFPFLCGDLDIIPSQPKLGLI